MNRTEKLFDAFRNCITQPGCGKCVMFEECNHCESDTIRIPKLLCLDVLNEMKHRLPIKPEIGKDGNVHCGKCGIELATFSVSFNGSNKVKTMRSRFCCMCGTEVDWDE